ncbi:MAG: EAL domain-containing protein [Gammaproteobacteria bacterium]|nr:EAL domain-containing protein [Gammaproteobacteria bacterium]
MPLNQSTLNHSQDYKQYFRAGDIIFKESDSGRCAYIIKRGRVEIATEDNGDKIILAELSSGELFGEMAIIDDSPRWATARAIDDVVLIIITRDAFLNHLEETESVVRMFLHTILAKFKSVHAHLLALGEQKHLWDLRSNGDLHNQTIDQTVRATVDALKFEQSLLKGIENEEFELYYQPIIDLRADRVAGFEALIRWNHPRRGFISPLDFIPAAEQNGLIVPIGQWVFEQACKALKEFNQIQELQFLSINVSGRQFLENDLIENFVSFSRDLELSPKQIKLEITESILMKNPEQSREVLNDFCDHGFQIAIDDFGTGYSSLSYLNSFPISTLKIDRSFVSTMLKDKGSMNIVRGIAGLSHSLDMDIVAEGPETKEELKMLKEVGCEFAQGYVISKPLPLKQAIEFIKKY